MHWIKTKKIVGAVLALSVAGCANQSTILPEPEREMIDIYRAAINGVDAKTARLFDPYTLCSQLDLSGSAQDCQQTLTAHAESVYRSLDEQTPEPSLEYGEYTRTTKTELDNLFPRHANPDMVIYVYPHLATRTRAPIPGYTTVIPLYERVEYRLPGESALVEHQFDEEEPQ